MIIEVPLLVMLVKRIDQLPGPTLLQKRGWGCPILENSTTGHLPN